MKPITVKTHVAGYLCRSPGWGGGISRPFCGKNYKPTFFWRGGEGWENYFKKLVKACILEVIIFLRTKKKKKGRTEKGVKD